MHHTDDLSNNPSHGAHLNQVATHSRRRVLHLGAVFAGAALACETKSADPVVDPSPNSMVDAGVDGGTPSAMADAGPQPMAPMPFQPVAISTQDALLLSPQYLSQVVFAWGDPIDGQMPTFKKDASETAAEQAKQAGMHHDGMHFFPLPLGSTTSDRGLLVLNHEYVDQGLLFSGGYTFDEAKPLSAELVAKSQNAHGVSVVEIALQNDMWKVVASNKARRITANTPMAIQGPAAGKDAMKTKADPTGKVVLGTLNNCGSGQTPWGTYLTCEENFNGLFSTRVAEGFVQTELMKRYGVADTQRAAAGAPAFKPGRNGFAQSYGWFMTEDRFAVELEPNESNRFGWVVEINPFDASSTPVKRTALGRFKHESATVALAKDNRVVVYMGDDQSDEYIYKFVSSKKYDAQNAAANKDLLDEGALYVAKLDNSGSGTWIELSFGSNGLTAPDFVDQGDVLIRTRMAADKVGATKMDRPEWIAVNPKNKEVCVALTNNSGRKTGDGAANPRSNNRYGQILRWTEAESDAAATTFAWDLLVLAGNPNKVDDPAKGEYTGTINGDAFASPDCVWFDPNGRLWILTDVSTSSINAGPYEGMGNNQMLVMDMATKKSKRLLVGPKQSEITGITSTPDQKWLFFNVQHPGETSSEVNGTDPSTWPSHWPDGGLSRPRSATVAIRRQDFAPVGN